ncbi:phytoene desaturase family protein [Saccharopolyspora sp. TS4A08]|uniref:Phytoene desaturase family protein n=1 Tax=Saccharopolyspora ipomoeae TaxID=3042027 RepID=A0ABT6PU70_9PSEU|nr:phytoene desaturase family protein [Saccharopolyspora sp. TS4A08]MDI2030986.1 phytoene desaturase family protein [Saccharopolyspora sp. TS4A08]
MRAVAGRTDHVVIVGAGLAGLSAALHLAGTGRRVTVLERADVPGGRAGLHVLDGYRIDTGPTVLTMPELLDEALHAVGSSVRERLDLIPLHPAYQARFADGSELAVHTDAEAMEQEVRRLAGPREADGYRRLRRWLTEVHRAEMHRFIDANFDSPLDLVSPELARLVALGGFGRFGPAIGRFLRDERVRRVFSFQALYAGLDPRRALALYAVISYMDTVNGVWFPRGGMHAVPTAMAEAAASAGVEFRYGAEVTGLERSGDRITAVRTADERVPADAVVLTPDLPVVHRLLGRSPKRRLRWSPSAVVLHAGTTRDWGSAHHTISFGEAWQDTFTEIIRDGRPMSDPSLLITRPTASDPSLAPEGRELHYVLAPCPNLRTGPIDWRRVGPRYRDELVGVLERRGFAGFDAAIETSELVTPLEWAAEGHAAGTPFSAAHTFSQTGPFRPRNLVRGLGNVVLAGSGTTPGVGVPPVLISGKLAAQRVVGGFSHN